MWEGTSESENADVAFALHQLTITRSGAVSFTQANGFLRPVRADGNAFLPLTFSKLVPLSHYHVTLLFRRHLCQRLAYRRF